MNTELAQNPSSETSPAVWLERFRASEKYMKKEFRPRYELARKRLRSEYKTFSQGKYPCHNQVNLVYSIGNAFVNSVAFNMPDVDCTAREDAEVEHVENSEIKINDIIKDKKVKKTVKRIVWDAYLGGFGTIWPEYEYADAETGEPLVDPMTGQPSVDPMTGLPQMKRVITKNDIILNRVRPDLLRFPRGFDFDNFQDSPWIGFDLLMPVDEVKANEQFDPTAREMVKGGDYDDLLNDKENKTEKGDKGDVKYAKLHYAFEKPKQDGRPFKMIVLADDVGEKFLQNVEYDKGHVGYPLKFLYFNPLDDDCAYPCGDPWLWEAQLSAIDKFWKRLENHTKRMNRKYIYDKKNITTTEQGNLSKNDDMEFVGLENKQNRPLGDLVLPVPDNPIAKDNFSFYEIARGLLSELSPKSALSRGAKDDTTDTATEAEIINIGEQIDTDARIDDVREFFKDIVLDIAGILEKSLVGEMPIQGKASTGNEVTRTAGKGEFTSKLNIDVDVDSLQHQNKDVHRRQLLDLVGQLATVEPMLNREGKGIKFSIFIEKMFQHMNVRGADQALYDTNLRDPAQEHEDMVFGSIPMIVQPNEDSEKHLKEHQKLANDPIATGVYEQLKPGFGQMLNDHIIATGLDLQKKQAQGKPAVSKAPSGKRPPIATEIGRSNKV